MTAGIANCPQPQPEAAICQVVHCMPDGRWQSDLVPLPHSCDTFLGFDTGQCDTDAVCQLPVPTGYLTPHYYILTVAYAPPGRAGGGAKSSVTYGASNSSGNEVKAGSSFKAGVTTTAEASLGWANLNMSTSYAYSKTNTESNSLKMSKNEGTVIGPAEGGSTDAVDHDFDAIYLWLNPRIYMNGTLSGGVQWSLFPSDNLGGAMDIQLVYVTWLKNPATMPVGVKNALAFYGITPAEYPNILTADPVANGQDITPNRFALTGTTVPYEPAATADSNPIPFTVSLTNDRSTTTSQEATSSHTVKLGASVGSSNFGPFATAKLSVSTEFTWNFTNAHSRTESNTQTASFKITGPSFGYTGPTDMRAWYDTMYGTFLFAPITYPPIVHGIVRNVAAQPLAGQAVTLTSGGVSYKTVTRANGEYRFFDVPAGPSQVTMSTTTWSVPVQTTPTSVDLTLPSAGCQLTIGAPVASTYGQAMHFTATAHCDNGPADVQWYHKVNSGFDIVRPYSATPSFDYVANEVGTAQFFATVRTHGTTAVQATSPTASIAVADNAPLCTSVELTAPTANQLLRVNVAKTLSAHATCPAGAVAEYQYWVKRPTDANWTILPGYTTGTRSWTPPAAGAWVVSAVARATSAHVNYQVRTPGTPVSVTP